MILIHNINTIIRQRPTCVGIARSVRWVIGFRDDSLTKDFLSSTFSK